MLSGKIHHHDQQHTRSHVLDGSRLRTGARAATAASGWSAGMGVEVGAGVMVGTGVKIGAGVKVGTWLKSLIPGKITARAVEVASKLIALVANAS